MTAFLNVVDQLAPAWWQYVTAAALQGAVVGGLLLAIVACGRRRPASLKYALLVVALAKFALPPFAAMPMGLFSRLEVATQTDNAPSIENATRTGADDVLVREPSDALIASGAPATASADPNARSVRQLVTWKGGGPDLAAQPPSPSATQESPRQTLAGRMQEESTRVQAAATLSWRGWLLIGYLAGVLTLGVRLTLQLIRLELIVRRSQPADAYGAAARKGHQHLFSRLRPQVWLSADVAAPCSAGLFRPVILLPVGLAAELSKNELDAILAHETAHHRRGDLWINAAQAVLSVAWWFHPIMWWLSASLRRVREDCCDDVVLARRLVTNDDYCGTLLRVARFGRRRSKLSDLALCMARSQHPLGARMRRIMDPRVCRSQRLSVLGWLIAAGLAALAWPGLTAVSSQTAPAGQPDTTVAPATAPDDAEAQPGRIVSGRVLSPDGKPVAGARLWARKANAGRSDTKNDLIVAHGTTDEAGRFRLDIHDNATPQPGDYPPECSILVFHPQQGLAVHVARGEFPTMSIDIRTAPDRRTKLTIHSPDGRPARGVGVRPQYVDSPSGPIIIPDEAQAAVAAVSDAQGHITLLGVRPDTFCSLVLESPEFGQQHVHLSKDDSRETPLVIHPVGRVVGRVILPRGVSASQVKEQIRLVTNWTSGINRTPHWNGVAEIKLNDAGEFSIPAIAQGPAKLVAHAEGDCQWLVVPKKDLLVTAGETATIELSVVRAATVRGKTIDRETKQPIAGVSVYIHDGDHDYWRTTDTAGEFHVTLRPGATGSCRYHPPTPYLDLEGDELSGRGLRVPDRAGEFRLPDVELARGATLTGRTLTGDGKPMAKVRVTARWLPNGGHAQQQAASESDSGSNFIIEGVSPSDALTVQAWQEQICVGQASIEANVPKTVDLRIEPLMHVTLSGRVVDEQGKPLAAMKYQIVQSIDSSPNMIGFCPVYTSSTASDGTFATARKFPRPGDFELQALVDDLPLARTTARDAKSADGGRFADLVVKHVSNQVIPGRTERKATRSDTATSRPNSAPEIALVDFSGLVLNRDGQPIAGAEIVGWSRAERMRRTTDDVGRFKLPRVSAAEVWVFVRAEGYRAHGGCFQPGHEPTRITLSRVAEAETAPVRAIAAPTVNDEQLADVRNRLRQFAEVVMAADDHSAKMDLQRLAPRIDPDFAIELLRDPRFDISKVNISGVDDHRKWHDNSVRIVAMQYWLSRDFRKAEALANAAGVANDTQMCIKLADHLPEDQRARRGEFLDKALAQVRTIKRESARIEGLTAVGQSLASHGETDRAMQVLREASELAKQPPAKDDERAAVARGYLAWTMATIDLPTALELLKGVAVGSRDHTRFYGNVAHQIAAGNPAEAERLLNETAPSQRRDLGVRVAYRMAPVDLPRAQRIAEQIDELPLRAYAKGVMARAIVDKDAAAARKLLTQAYAELGHMLDEDYSSGRSIFEPYPIAVALLRQVEAVEPERLGDYFWRVLSWRRNTTDGFESRVLGHYGEGDRMRLSDPVLAAFVARYDRDLARKILMPADDETLDLGVTYAPDFFFGGLAAVDSVAAVEAISKLPEATDRERQDKLKAWSSIVRMITCDGDDRWKLLMDGQYHFWRPDKVDF